MKRHLILTCCLIFFFVRVSGQDNDAPASSHLVVKVEPLGFATDNLIIDIEKPITKRISAELRTGLMRPDYLDDVNSAARHHFKIWGWMVKAGPKLYLKESQQGWSLSPQFVYSYWKDLEFDVRNSENLRVVSVGAEVAIARQIKVMDRLAIEPHVRFGYISSTSSVDVYDDVRNEVVNVKNVVEKSAGEAYFSHLSLWGNISAGGGLKVGFIF